MRGMLKSIGRISMMVAAPALCYANGGPVDGSNILSAGGLAPLQVPEVTLVSEDLQFTPDGDWVDVEAVYTLANRGAGVSLEYGFPVEFAAVQWNPEETAWVPSELPYFTMTADGRELEVRGIDDPEHVTRRVMDYGEIEVLTKWFASTLDFGAGDTLVLAVSYRIRSFFEDISTTKDFWESYSERSFTYDLDPAGRWGDGTVGDFRFTLDLRQVMRYGDSAVRVPEGGEWSSDSLYEIHSTDLRLAGAEPLVVAWNADIRSTSEFITRHSIPLDLISSVTASSTLPDQGGCSYSPNNLFDGDLTTAWAEGAPGAGAGEWIEVSLSGFNVMEIALIGGYAKNGEAYLANARPAEIEYEVALDPELDSGRISDAVTLTDPEWRDAGPCSFSPLVRDVTFLGDTGEPVTTIRLNIGSVYPGSSCDDLCITELFILGYPAGEPGIWWND
jgi:hypothetical protein